MSIYISVDGGGTKFSVIAFNDNLELLGAASTKGTNLLFNKKEEVLGNVHSCFDMCINGVCNDCDISTVYTSFAGESNLVFDLIVERFAHSKIVRVGEYQSAMLAGGLFDEGIVAISGTGGGVHYIDSDKKSRVIGGWGALMGDWGSGFWIGQQGCFAAIKMHEGWGEETKIYDELMTEFGFEHLRNLVDYVYTSKSYQQTIASLSKTVSRAAVKGDEVAINIFKRAGVYMAKQLVALLGDNIANDECINVVINGGAWKGNVGMFNAFSKAVHEVYPDFNIIKPVFEPVVGGVIKYLMENDVDITTIVLEKLKTNFNNYLWKGVGYAAK